jgi:pyruvate formate-lyase activating enzyme-like uncharacterized protein
MKTTLIVAALLASVQSVKFLDMESLNMSENGLDNLEPRGFSSTQQPVRKLA